MSFAWTQLTGPSTAIFGSASAATTTVSGLVQGVYSFQLQITDALSITVTATVQVTVDAAPVPGPPMASAGSNQTINLPTTTATLNGSASETNGTIVSYAWAELSGPATATINAAGSASTVISGLSVAGTYVFQLLATDNTGNTVTSTVQIVVDAAPPPTPPPPPPPSLGPGQYITKVVVAEYRTWYIDNNQVVWAYNNAAPLPVQFPIGGRKAVDGVGGFNYFRILDDQGYIWTSKIDYTTNTVRMDTDTTGGPFSGNWYVDGYGHTGLTIRADSSVWYYGVDCYSFFYPGGSLINMSGITMKPTQLSPAGLKFKKVLFGGNGLIGLTTTGQVYKWLAGNKTPVLMTTPAPATDVFISHLDINGCIIPDPGETSGLGYPYIWGATTSMYGGGTAFTQPTSIKALWHMTAPIKEISVDWNTIHYIDSLGNMYGTGFNSFGEVGNGQEFINKYNYPGFPGYGWDLVDYENPTGLPVQLGSRRKVETYLLE